MLYSRRLHSLHFLLLTGFLSWQICGTARAASSVLIWPIDPVLEADQQASALWLENRGNEPANLQIRVFSWSQSGFEDHYDSQRDIIGSPPVARIEPGQKQLIRLTRTREIPAGQEHAYRVIIDEIPSPASADAPAGQSAAAIRFQMRYSVPLFVYGEGLWSKEDVNHKRDAQSAGHADLSWGKLLVDGRPYVEIRNRGAVHARMTDVALQQGGQVRPLADGLLGYVLPGAAMRWPAPQPPTANQTLQIRINGATQVQNLSPSQ